MDHQPHCVLITSPPRVFLGALYTIVRHRIDENTLLAMRPYAPENTGSRLISEVKQGTAQSVLWWGTTREYWVLHVFKLFKFYGIFN